MSAIKNNWAKLPIFKDLSPQYLDLLARTATDVACRPGELLFHEGEEADTFYVVAEGNIAIEIFTGERGPVTIQTVGAAEVLGWSWIVEPYRWHFDARATAACQLISFDATLVRKSFDEHPEFGFAMFKRFLPVIVQRMQSTRLQLLDVYHVHH